MSRIHNPNKCKIHRSYTVGEVSFLYNVHRNTVINWISLGLKVCDDKRPILILGKDLKEFIKQQRTLIKRKCKPTEFFCLKCKEPRIPNKNTIEFIAENITKGRITAACSVCNSRMNKYFKIANLSAIQRDFSVVLQVRQKHIG